MIKLRSEKTFDLLILFLMSIATSGAFWKFGEMTPSGFFEQDIATQSLFIGIGFVVVSSFVSLIQEIIPEHILPELRCHQISSVIMTLMTLSVAYAFVQRNRPNTYHALAIGAFWSVLYLIYELISFAMVRVDVVPLGFRQGITQTAGKMVSEYNVGEGRLLGLVTLAQMIAPVVIANIV
jgi:hypothetical protein